jgi:hypothetical protein
MLTNLTALSLAHSAAADDSAHTLPPSCSSLAQLQKLNLRDSGLAAVPSHIQVSLASPARDACWHMLAHAGCTHVQGPSVNGSRNGALYSALLPTCPPAFLRARQPARQPARRPVRLQHMTALRTLLLGMNHLGAEGPNSEGVPLALSMLCQIEELDLSLGDTESLLQIPQVRECHPHT